jgi:hypothetical protein
VRESSNYSRPHVAVNNKPSTFNSHFPVVCSIVSSSVRNIWSFEYGFTQKTTNVVCNICSQQQCTHHLGNENGFSQKTNENTSTVLQNREQSSSRDRELAHSRNQIHHSIGRPSISIQQQVRVRS